MSRDRVTQDVNWQEDWLATFDAHGVQFLVLDIRHDGDLLQLVRSEPGWAVDFQDTDAVLLTRTRALA
jgi:hypothetical protein